MTTPNNQPTPPEGMRLLTPEEYSSKIKEGTLMKWGEEWFEAEVGIYPYPQNFYAVPITTVPATGDTNNQCCMATFELGNGEYVSPCHLPKGHEGNHKGTCLGSNLIWPKGFSSEEEMVLSQRGAPGDTTNEKGGDQRQDKAFLEAAITEQIAQAAHWKEHYTADPKDAEDKAYWSGRHTAFQEALNLIQSAPVDQRQELPRYFVVAHDPEFYACKETTDIVAAFKEICFCDPDHPDDDEEVEAFRKYIENEDSWCHCGEAEWCHLKWQDECGAIEVFRITQ